MGWSRVGDVKVEHRHDDTVETAKEHVVGIGYERINFL
jgi:hypothetical protein